MYRSHTCGELREENIGQEITLSGWVAKNRDLGSLTFVDLRDRYGITQLVFDEQANEKLTSEARKLGREFVIQATGKVRERSNKNNKIPTGNIEIEVNDFSVLNISKTPPFTIEDQTDGGDEIRMQYRYLDLRRDVVRNNMVLRHRIAIETRNYLNDLNFIEVETPVLIKSTPEGARDFLVPSRMNEGQFYALPQSPQTFKQLLMVSGFDRYFQIVKCFRDEDLRADRQPEFTQIDCEMSFVNREDILNTFEGYIKHIFKKVKNIDLAEIPRMTYDDAIKYYGSDKPDLRFDMSFKYLKDKAVNVVSGKDFKVFDEAETVVGIVVKNAAVYTRKQLDELTEWVKDPKRGMSGLIYARNNDEGLKSSVDKFYNAEDLGKWNEILGSEKGDLILILAGNTEKTQNALGDLRLEMAGRMGLKNKSIFKPLWVLDFPLLEWNEDDQRFFAMHHPFTSPVLDEIPMLETQPKKVKANAYDLVINGWEIGGGSIRIHDRNLQKKMFSILGFTDEEAQAQFGFLMNAFEFGAPPHGGIAFGFDRLCSLFGGADSIRDFIAFPKNNQGRDTMIDSPSAIDEKQLKELKIKTDI